MAATDSYGAQTMLFFTVLSAITFAGQCQNDSFTGASIHALTPESSSSFDVFNMLGKDSSSSSIPSQDSTTISSTDLTSTIPSIVSGISENVSEHVFSATAAFSSNSTSSVWLDSSVSLDIESSSANFAFISVSDESLGSNETSHVGHQTDTESVTFIDTSFSPSLTYHTSVDSSPDTLLSVTPLVHHLTSITNLQEDSLSIMTSEAYSSAEVSGYTSSLTASSANSGYTPFLDVTGYSKIETSGISSSTTPSLSSYAYEQTANISSVEISQLSISTTPAFSVIQSTEQDHSRIEFPFELSPSGSVHRQTDSDTLRLHSSSFIISSQTLRLTPLFEDVTSILPSQPSLTTSVKSSSALFISNISETVSSSISSTLTTISPTSSVFAETSADLPSTSVTPYMDANTSISENTTQYVVNRTTDVGLGNYTKYKIMISFYGNCEPLRENARLKLEFWKAFIDVLQSTIALHEHQLSLEHVECTPFRIFVLIRHEEQMENETTHFLDPLKTKILSSKFCVPIISDTNVLNFTATNFEILEILIEDGTMKDFEIPRLEMADIIIISIASFLFAMLVLTIVIVSCRECYVRKKVSSFNLIEVPHVNLKLTDFTLTKIPRPRMIYRDNSRKKPDCVPASEIRYSANGHSNSSSKVKVNVDEIRVRMSAHQDGVLVGVTYTNPPSVKNDLSYSSSPINEDPSTKLLSKGGNTDSSDGVTNPIFYADEDELDVNKNALVQDDDNEQML